MKGRGLATGFARFAVEPSGGAAPTPLEYFAKKKQD